VVGSRQAEGGSRQVVANLVCRPTTNQPIQPRSSVGTACPPRQGRLRRQVAVLQVAVVRCRNRSERRYGRKAQAAASVDRPCACSRKGERQALSENRWDPCEVGKERARRAHGSRGSGRTQQNVKPTE